MTKKNKKFKAKLLNKIIANKNYKQTKIQNKTILILINNKMKQRKRMKVEK